MKRPIKRQLKSNLKIRNKTIHERLINKIKCNIANNIICERNYINEYNEKLYLNMSLRRLMLKVTLEDIWYSNSTLELAYRENLQTKHNIPVTTEDDLEELNNLMSEMSELCSEIGKLNQETILLL